MSEGNSSSLTGYLESAAAAITTRIADLADTAIRQRPAWMSLLGEEPEDSDDKRDWQRCIATVAAYRDQHKITASDPRQILGPYVEQGSAGCKAYWHAAESVLAARQITGLEPTAGPSPAGQATAQTGADIYRSLPEEERGAIAGLIAAGPGAVSFSGLAGADEIAARYAGNAACLTAVLADRGYVIGSECLSPLQDPESGGEPYEAVLARRRQPTCGSATRADGPGTHPAGQSQARPRVQTQPRLKMGHDDKALVR
jgi:hypothetical protein